MSMPTIQPIHNWRNKKNSNARYAVHIRITIDRKQRYVPIAVPLKPTKEEWSGKDEAWVKNSNPYAFEINNRIKEKKDTIVSIIKRYYGAGTTITFPVIFEELKKYSNAGSFNGFFAEFIKHPTDKLEPDTFKKYNACLGHLNAYNPDIKFHDLTPELVEEFHQHCKTKAGRQENGLKGSTIDSYFDAFRKVVGLARKANFITKEVEDTLFEDLHIDINKSKRTFLTFEEIKEWKKIKFSAAEKHLERDRDMFLLQIYTGFYYKDLINLKKEHLVKDHEHGYFILGEKGKNKNDEQTIIPLFKFPDAASLVEKYANKNENDPYIFRRDVFLAEPVYNRHLKDIAPKAKITKLVTNKVARHTNAQLWIRLRTQKPIVSKMFGPSQRSRH